MRLGALLIGSLVAVSCAGDRDAPSGDDGTPPASASITMHAPATKASDASDALALGDPAAMIDASKLPRPYRARGDEAATANAACVRCHPGEAEAWSASHHRRAFENPAFQASYAIEPTPFCRGCHAPESAAASPSKEADAIGVGCVTCHVATDDVVLAAPRPEGPSVETAPHPIERAALFAGAGACAGCHEFTFPFASGKGDGHFMQTTVREHARSPASERSCASCHMPMRDGRRSHGFADVRDPAFLRSQLEITATRETLDTIVVTVEQKRPGHAFPTGDLFRRVEVGALVRDARGDVVARKVAHLSRTWALYPGERERRLSQDSRVMFGPREVGLTLPLDARSQGLAITWWVTYQRVAKTADGHVDGEATIESEVPLASGTLPPPER